MLLLFSFGLRGQNPCGPQGQTFVLNGLQITYFNNDRTGKIAVRAMYKDGMLEGEYMDYYPDGSKHSILQYHENYLSGECLYFYPGMVSKLQRKCYYKYGALISWQEFFEDGTLEEENSGKGVTMKYYPNGAKESEANLQGIYSYYYDNGQLKYRMEYKNHVMQLNEVVFYYPTGKIKRKEKYKGGMRTWNWKSYYENGNLMDEAKCSTRNKVGSLVEYYANGNVKTISHFIPGQPIPATENNILLQGTKIYFNDAENITKEEKYCQSKLLIEVYFKDGKASTWNNVFRNDNAYLKLYDSTRNSLLSEGIFIDNTLRYGTIKNWKGKNLLKAGNGEYFGPYSLVNDESAFLNDSLQDYIEPSYLWYYQTGSFFYDWYPLNKIPVRSMEGFHSHFLELQFALAKGEFKDGLKEGEWIEGDFLERVNRKKISSDDEFVVEPKNKKIDLNSMYNCYAIGNYAKGKREGRWQLVSNDIIFSGEYKNGKRTGVWKSIARGPELKKEPEKFWDYYRREKPFVTGFYKDGLADSAWTIYYEHSATIAEQRYYRKGWFLGTWSDSYGKNGKLKMQASLSGDTLKNKYFSPLGDEIIYFEYGNMNSYYTVKNGEKNGPYYSWDYGGRITNRGQYLHGVEEGDWYEFGYYGDTTGFRTFKNGLMEGRYKHKDDRGITEGLMKNGEKIGLWTEYNYEEKCECVYNKGDKKIINCWKKDKQVIKDGAGVITTEYSSSYDPYSTVKEEKYYKNGEPIYLKEYYKNGNLKALKYITAKGDSLVSYNSPFGGLCVNSGEGVITEYDSQNRIQQILFYENGKLQKTEYYRHGKYAHTTIYFGSKYEKQPTVTRRVKKIKDGEYIVEISVEGLTNGDGFQKLEEKIPLTYEVKTKEAASATTSNMAGKLKYIWTSNKAENFSVSYTVTVPKAKPFEIYYGGQLSFVRDNVKHTVDIKENNIIYVEK